MLLHEMHKRPDALKSLRLHRNISIQRNGEEVAKLPERVLTPQSRFLTVEIINDEEMSVELVRPPKEGPPPNLIFDESTMLLEYFKYTEAEGYRYCLHIIFDVIWLCNFDDFWPENPKVAKIQLGLF